MDKALQFPGVSRTPGPMPIKARIDMLATGIRTPVGVKVIGKDLKVELEKLAREIETAIKSRAPAPPAPMPSASSAVIILEIEPDRKAACALRPDGGRRAGRRCVGAGCGDGDDNRRRARALYGGQHSLSHANCAPTRKPSPRDVLVPLAQWRVDTAWAQVATVSNCDHGSGHASAPRMPNSPPTSSSMCAIATSAATWPTPRRPSRTKRVKFPVGYHARLERAVRISTSGPRPAAIVVPLTLMIILLLLYLNFRRVTETLIVMLSLPFALVGGLWLMWWLGFNLSVASPSGSSPWRASRPRPASSC
jgi:Cu(I)/Ag(I) efflux system membrane protein CusA/SilA